MSFQESISVCFSKYCDFTGRARRSEYWYFTLFDYLVSLVVYWITNAIGGGNLLSTIVSLVLFLPGLGVTVRRLHDIGKTGWAILIILVPVVGIILFYVWLARNSQAGENRFGSNPKEASF